MHLQPDQGHAALQQMEPKYLFLVKINVFNINTLFFFNYYFKITRFQVTVYDPPEHN